MSYEDFLSLPLERVHQYKHSISFKQKNNIDLTFEEDEVLSHMIRYCSEVNLRLKRIYLERCYKIKYQKTVKND